MELSEVDIEIIKREARRIDFGKVVVELNSEQGKIDIVSERRERIRRGNTPENGSVSHNRFHSVEK